MKHLKSKTNFEFSPFLRLTFVAFTFSAAIAIQSDPAGIRGLSSKSDPLDLVIQQAGLTTGEYEALEGKTDEQCLAGELRFIKESGAATLMLGSKPLILGVGAGENFKREDEQCQFSSSAKVTAGQIIAWHQEKCGKRPAMRFETELNKSESGITYQRRVQKNGKTTQQFTCQLKLVKSP